MTILKRFLLTLMLIAAFPCFSWNDTGHMVVAEIAYQQLLRDNPELLQKLIAFLKANHPRRDDLQKAVDAANVGKEDQDHYFFLVAATWPDMVRALRDGHADPEHHKLWHFVNYTFALDKDDRVVLKRPNLKKWESGDPENILQALDMCESMLSNSKDAEEKSRMLTWTMHLIGDIHQPLHCTACCSSTFPTNVWDKAISFQNGDAGGNLWFFDKNSESKHRPQLHAYWDDILGTDKSLAYVMKIAKEITDSHERKGFAEDVRNEIDIRKWASQESAIAQRSVYCFNNDKLPIFQVPNDDYHKSARQVADEQVALAGYRLADRILKDTKGW